MHLKKNCIRNENGYFKTLTRNFIVKALILFTINFIKVITIYIVARKM